MRETALVPQLCFPAVCSRCITGPQQAWLWPPQLLVPVSGFWTVLLSDCVLVAISRGLTVKEATFLFTPICLDSQYEHSSCAEGLGVTEEKSVSCVLLRAAPRPGRFTHRGPHFLPFRPTPLPESTSTT